MDNFSAIIDAWGGPKGFAAAIGVDESHASVMRHRRSIPASYWRKIAEAAKSDGKAITLETLAAIAETKRATPSPERAA